MNGDQDLLNSSHADLLKHIFDEIDTDQNQGLSFDELSLHLSKKSGKPFNSELLLEIFRTMDHDQNSIISLEEFVQGYSKAEHLIISQILQLKLRISENAENLAKTQRSLLEARAKALQNKAENNLIVNIKKAEGLKAAGVTGNRAPIVCITCEGREIQTNPIPNPSNPEWNQSFTFPISEGLGDILLEVYDSERNTKTNFIGQVVIPLRALADQEVHEELLQLKGKENDRLQGKILVSLQWIYDLPAYLESMVRQYEEVIKDDKGELSNLEDFLKELKAPTRVSILPDWLKTNKGLEFVEKKISESVQVAFEKTVGQSLVWPKFTFFCILFFLFMSTLTSFFRPDFLNVNFYLADCRRTCPLPLHKK